MSSTNQGSPPMPPVPNSAWPYFCSPYLYRVYDHDDSLIYIGSTYRLRTRLIAHRNTSWWAPTVGRVKARLHPNIDTLRGAERAAVLSEHPRWNRVELAATVNGLPRHRLHDYVFGWAATLVGAERRGRARVTDFHRQKLAGYDESFAARFGDRLGFNFDTIDISAPPRILEVAS